MSQHLADNSRTAAEEKLNPQEEAEVFVFPASFAQQRLWFLDQLFPGNPFYNVSAALRLTGALNGSALEETFNEIVRRHEALRTTFKMLEGQPVQVIAPTLTIPLPVVDLRSLPAAEQEVETLQLATKEQARPFDLSEGPLLRVMLLQINSSEHVLLLNLHHIVSDGWSIGVLIRELGALYTGFTCNVSTPLPELPIQYADFAHWQREWLVGEVLETQLAYWRQQLDKISPLDLPTDRPRLQSPTYRGATQVLDLPKSLSQELKVLSQHQGVTLFMTLLAAFQTLLYRYTQQEDIAVGSPIANRNRSEIEGLIGFFVNSLVLRTNLSGNPTFLELLGRVREVAIGAYAHQNLPFERLVEELHPERNLSYHPLFQVVFSLQNTPIQTLELPGLTILRLEFNNPSAKFALEFHMWESPEGLRGQVVYSSDLFDDTTMTRMLGHFQTLLESIIANPQQHLCDLSLLTERERHQLLVEWNDTSQETKIVGAGLDDRAWGKQTTIAQNPPCLGFHQFFEGQVQQTPDAIALIFEDQKLTYRQLNNRANNLAHHLQKLGIGPEVLVGICIERSLEMVVGLLGILKAGGAYLPLDPTYPSERLSFMLEDAQVSFLLTHSALAPLKKGGWGYGQHQLSVICLDKDADAIAQESQENPSSSIASDNLAYVIYTSGSTGKPKGVLIQHRGLSNLCKAQTQVFNLQPSHRVLQFASLNFDASIFEIVMALQSGATLYLARSEFLLPGSALLQLLRDNGITHITLPPSLLAVLPAQELPALRSLICAGEACSADIVRHWAAGRRFFNAYGPTEATVWSTLAEIRDDSEKPSIGRPIANTQAYILDSHLQPVPIAVKGELYIGGHGLARGYLNQPELTAERFIPHPFSHKLGDRLYKTGDLARYQPDGSIEFLGRIDEQVKIRGFRIELGEIEAVLSQHPLVRKVVVIATEVIPGDKRLVGYIVPSAELQVPSGTSNSALRAGTGAPPLPPSALLGELRCFLKEKLPAYMLPSAIVMLESLPLTPNGKVDRRALPAPDPVSRPIETGFVAPSTSTESKLAQIWAQVLNLNRVGIHDNFFDLGGDSLLAVRLMDEINKQFDRLLPLSAIFSTPTVAGLASTLGPRTDSLPWSPLVTMQPAGSNPPFFCVHPIFGVVFPYYELAHHLAPNQPFYGLQPFGIDGERPPLTCIEDMAARYIEALRTVQPNGPYFLGGWSFGGLVAFEMAQQLLASGHEVALLAILDTLAPVSANKPSFWESCKFLITTVGRYIWPFLWDYLYLLTAPDKHPSDAAQHDCDRSAPSSPKFNQLLRRLGTNLSWHSILGQAAIANFMPQESKRKILRELTLGPMFPVFQANSQATLNYVPQTYPHKITLFRTSPQASMAERDPTLGWSELTRSGVEVNIVPGNHLTMLRKPNVQTLSEQLRQSLEKAMVMTPFPLK